MPMPYNTGMETVDRENTWLSIQEAAEQLGVNPRTVRRYIRLGRLGVSRISNKVVRIRLADIDRFMETGVSVKETFEDHPDEQVEPQPRPIHDVHLPPPPASPRMPRPGSPAIPSGFTPGRFG